MIAKLFLAALAVAAAAVGSPAPPFSRPASDGKTVSLAQFHGKQTVVLAFFPKAFTGG
jgi:peroxiredoxin Q/BCP